MSVNHTKSSPPSAHSRPLVYALVGNPNCGKSTLFNALTGLKQKVGNYPGVTVEKKVGAAYSQHGHPITLIDLPGAYSLAARSPDEAVTRDVLLGRRADTPQPDRILCVVDAANLERNLYLVHQVLDLGRPVILVLNMMDLAEQAGINIRVARLEKLLGIPVIACEAANGKGIVDIKLAMSRADLPLSRHAWDVPAAIAPAVAELQSSLVANDGKAPLIARAEALLLLTDQDAMRVAGSTPLSARTHSILEHWKKRWDAGGMDWSGALVNSRYDAISAICAGIVEQKENARTGPSRSDKIDAVVTHPVWGWLVLGALMTVLFLSIFTFAGYPMELIESWFDGLAGRVKESMAPGDLRDLITDGAITGVGGVVVFLPQILILFFFIGLLESTGYMARAAFIMDRVMSFVGLNGKAFIPLLSAHACAIPGIMAARTIESPRDRLVTILIAPFMSCSARLPVYFLMIATIVPGGEASLAMKVGLMMLMYMLGPVGAFGFAWLFKRTLLKSEPPVLIMELPPYRLPRIRDVLLHMFERAWMFLKRAGTVILGISIVLWFLSAYPKMDVAEEASQRPEARGQTEMVAANAEAVVVTENGGNESEQLRHSFAGMAGRAIEPVIKPLGFNWEIGIGLIGSLAAREMFVSTMKVVYNVESEGDDDVVPLRDALAKATWPDGRPLFTPLVCLTLMIFYVFAMQCLATLAVVRRETNSLRWPLFQLGYMTGTAWVVCFTVYQVGTLLGF
ncbi:ferrous iron transport protein B [Ereboglobus luteus]|nr:ferrous iron transport protein B [Ereboglobus luteus]